MDVFVYILRSTTNNWYYVGFTENISRRLAEHNLGEVSSTKAYKPFDLVFVQITETTAEARDFEKFLKVRFNKEALLDVVASGWRNWQTHRA